MGLWGKDFSQNSVLPPLASAFFKIPSLVSHAHAPQRLPLVGPSLPLFHTIIPGWRNPLACTPGLPVSHLAALVTGTTPGSRLLRGVGPGCAMVYLDVSPLLDVS